MSDTISKTLRKSTNETCIQDDQSNIVFELLSDSELHDLITGLNDDGIDEILLAPNVKRQTENKENLQLCQSNKSVDILQENVVNKTANLMDKQYPVPVFNNCSNATVNFNFKWENSIFEMSGHFMVYSSVVFHCWICWNNIIFI